MFQSQAQGQNRILTSKTLLLRLFGALRQRYRGIRRRTFRDPMASSYGIDVEMVERYLQEIRDLEDVAKRDQRAVCR